MFTTCQRAACLLISFLSLGVAGVAQPLTIAVATAPRAVNPATSTDAAAARLLQLTHPALLKWNAGYQPAGLAAAHCTQPTLTSAVCELPTGKTYTDGAPFTAASVAAWFQALQTNQLSPFAPQLKNISITAPAPTTVAFTLPSPTLSFLGTLTEIPLANPQNPQVGLGPYTLKGVDEVGTATLTANQPNIPPQLVFLPVPDATTRLLKLKKGEVDVVLNDLPPELFQWAAAQGFPTVSAPGTSYSYLGINFTNPTLARPEVREALALALNRPALRRFLLGKLAEPASTILPQTHPAAWKAPEEPYDPFTAETLLDEAALLRGPDNTRFTLTLLTSTDALSQRVSQVLQSQLQDIGINLQLRPTEWASFYAGVKKGNYDLVLLSWTGEQQPSFYNLAFNGAQTPPVGLNRGRLNDAGVNALTTQIMQAPTLQAQISATIKVQQRLAEVRPYIPLYRRHHVMVTAPGITGCAIPPSGAYTGLLSCHTASPTKP